MHTEAFTRRRFYTQKLLHTGAFTLRRFYTQTLLQKNTFTHRRLYTQTLLHTEAFTHRSFHTQHTEALYTQKKSQFYLSFWRSNLVSCERVAPDTTLHYITITLHDITIHTLITYVTYITYITLHYITLHYITLRYVTLHTYIHTYIYIYKHICVHVCIDRRAAAAIVKHTGCVEFSVRTAFFSSSIARPVASIHWLGTHHPVDHSFPKVASSQDKGPHDNTHNLFR